MKWLSRAYNAIIFVFLYLPILVLIIFSFNNSKNRVAWHGFTAKWYEQLFRNDLILDSLKITLIVAVLAAVIAFTVGVGLTLGISRYREKKQHAKEEEEV